MMRDAGPQERIFHELKHISHINFTFRDNKKPIDSVTQLSESLRVSRIAQKAYLVESAMIIPPLCPK